MKVCLEINDSIIRHINKRGVPEQEIPQILMAFVCLNGSIEEFHLGNLDPDDLLDDFIEAFEPTTIFRFISNKKIAMIKARRIQEIN